MNVTLISFGRRYSRPKADIIISALSLPNPWGIRKLRKLNGTNWKVQDHVVNTKKGKEFVDKAFKQILSEIKTKQDIIVAIECMGGKHRSVAVVCELYNRFVQQGILVTKRHRDMKRK